MPVERRSFHATNHANTILRNYNKLRLESQFCDVDITVGGETFSLHRALLSACCSYFHAMFMGGLVESSKNEIKICSVSPHIFRQLIEFIYSGDLLIHTDNVQELLAAADMLQLNDVVAACSQFMIENLDPSNCIGIYLFGDAHACKELKDVAKSYIHANFQDVIHEDEFFCLSQDDLSQMLKSEKLRIDNEFQVFKAAMSWILHDVQRRRRSVFMLMKCVRIPIISRSELDRYIGTIEDLTLKFALKKMCEDYKKEFSLARDTRLGKINPINWQPRQCARKNIYVIGGYSRPENAKWHDSIVFGNMAMFDSLQQGWSLLPPLNYARSGLGVATMKGKIFAIGGESNSLIYDNCEMYDPEEKVWKMIASLTNPRCGLGACTVNNSIYAFGGWVGTESGNTIEVYDPDINHWKICGRMCTPRYAMGIVAFEGLIYIIGGVNEFGSEMKSADSYNPVTTEWQRLMAMQTRRSHVGVAALEGHIYAVGGWNESEGALDSVESYNIEENVWEAIPPMSTRRAGASVAALNGFLYVIGGRTAANTFSVPTTVDSVDCYDPHTKSWLSVASIPSGRCDAGVAVL